MKITLQEKKVAYILKKSKRARRVRIVVCCGGDVVVIAPENLSDSIVENFVKEKVSWVLEKIEYFKQFKSAKALKFSKAHYLKHKDDALKLVLERAGYFGKKFKFEYDKISIRNQKTRWGSCSKKRNLNFNYKILFLPPKTRDYIIVHELCHLKEFNHSRKFWALIEKILPDYLEIKRGLKKQGLYFQ